MKNKKKLVIITSILAVGIPLLAIGTQSILKKVRDDYYKTQKEQIEAEKAREKAEKEQKLAQEKAEKEQKIVSEKTEKKQPIITGQSSQKNKNGKEKVKINNATPTFTPTATVVEKRELTPEEIKRAKKALKEARASYFSGNKATKLSKSSKSTDKIIIKSDSKGNVEAIRQTKEQNDKAQKILKEIRESYYKDKKK